MGASYWVLLVTEGFILGSVMFCAVIPKIILGVDVYEISEDRNYGTYNVFRYCGAKVGIPCLFLELAKGAVPVLIASFAEQKDTFAFSCVMIAPVLGHALGLFDKFRGGKCIAVSFGVMLGLIPVTWIGIVSLTVLYVLFSTVFKIKSREIRTVVVYVFFAITSSVALTVMRLIYAAVGCVMVSFFPIVKFSFSGIFRHR